MKAAQRTVAKVGLSLLAGVLFLAGCRPEEKFPVEPRLEFRSLEVFGDSASLVVYFTDGDGDVGLDPGDIQPPFDTTSAYYHNFFVEHYYRQNGEWVHHPFTEFPMYYRVPRLTPTGQNKALEGEIALAIDPLPLYVAPGADTVRYTVYMVDRALHHSNTVTSSELVLGQ
jgi:hypothetical protein